MRMWGVDPRLLCRQHLLGAHVETHMMAGYIDRGNDPAPWTSRGFMDTSRIRVEHDALAEEMVRRGYRHNSPLEYRDRLAMGKVDPTANLRELAERCARCRERQGAT